ncbi:MAG: MFS transporter, partial [Cystobacter sp.]
GLVTSAVYSTRMIGGSLTLVLSELMPGGFSGRFAFTAALAGAVALGLGLLAPGEVIRAPGDATP